MLSTERINAVRERVFRRWLSETSAAVYVRHRRCLEPRNERADWLKGSDDPICRQHIDLILADAQPVSQHFRAVFAGQRRRCPAGMDVER